MLILYVFLYIKIIFLLILSLRASCSQKNTTNVMNGLTSSSTVIAINQTSDSFLGLNNIANILGELVSSPINSLQSARVESNQVSERNSTHTSNNSVVKDVIASVSDRTRKNVASFPLFSSNFLNQLSGTMDVMNYIAKSLNKNLNAFKDSVLTTLPVLSDVRRTVIVCYRNYNPLKVFDMFMQRNAFIKLLVEVLSMVIPVRSIYLRHLGMEIFEVPDPLRLVDFSNTLASFMQFVEHVFEDQELGGLLYEDHLRDLGKENIDGTPLYNKTTASSDIAFLSQHSSQSKSERPSELQEFQHYNVDSHENIAQHRSKLHKQQDRTQIHGLEKAIHSSIHPNDAFYENQWAHIDSGTGWGIETPMAWSLWNENNLKVRFIVAVIDSGIDFKHADLKKSIWKNFKEICNNGIDDDKNGLVDDCNGWDFVHNHNDPSDDNGHGTQTAGIIAAEAFNSIGIAGVCWKCQLMILKALNKDIQGTVSGFVRAIDYAIGQGAKVSNNSYGGRGSSFAGLREAVKRAEMAGMIFVSAAGNYSTNNDNDKDPVYPASYEYNNVISVAAINRNGSLASFSNYGKKHVHIAAPGDKIFTCTIGGGYKFVDGTSFAVPFVTAAVALIWSREQNLTYKEVVQRVIQYTKYNRNLDGYIRTSGVLDVWAAMTENGNNLIYKMYVDNSKSNCHQSNPCDPNATCVDTETGVQCICKSGTRGNGYYCHDINECELSPCGPAATCVNHFGSFECICNEGFKQIGDSCTDIDECASKTSCPTLGICLNFVGSYDCICPPGNAWNAKSGRESKCLKINSPPSGPCANNGNCPYNSLCKAVGSFWHQSKTCMCLDGYKLVQETGECVRQGIMREQIDYYLDVIKLYRKMNNSVLDYYKPNASDQFSAIQTSNVKDAVSATYPSVSNDMTDYVSHSNGVPLQRASINLFPSSFRSNNCMFGVCLFAMEND